MASTHDKVAKDHSQMVHIYTALETDGAGERREIPFVVGVLADLTGQPAEALPPLKERGFISIDKENFNQVLKKQKPRVSYTVPNRLTSDGGNIPVELTFEEMDDFRPESIAMKVEPLRKLMELRQTLSELSQLADGTPLESWIESLAETVRDNPDLLRDVIDKSQSDEQ